MCISVGVVGGFVVLNSCLGSMHSVSVWACELHAHTYVNKCKMVGSNPSSTYVHTYIVHTSGWYIRTYVHTPC